MAQCALAAPLATPRPDATTYSRDTSCIMSDRRVFQRAGRQVQIQQEMAAATSNSIGINSTGITCTTCTSTGTSVWEASVVLSEYMANGLPPGYWKGKRVLELGAGTGLNCIVAAQLGAKQVVFSDANTRVLELAAKNAAANLSPSEMRTVDFSQLRWEEAADPTWKYDKGDQFDVILAADVTYSPAFIPLLIQVIERLRAPTSDVLIAHTLRSKSDVQGITMQAFYNKFQVDMIPALGRSVADCRDGHKPTCIYRLRTLKTT